MLIRIEAAQTLLDRLGPELDVEGVLDDLLGDAQHFCQSPRKNVFVASEEVNNLVFLFGPQTSPDLDGLGRVLGIDPDGLGVPNRPRAHGWVG
jgi:hypothetical protein